jgi:YbbR domain-containing protein
VSTDQNLVRVSGPESLVNQVKKALVNVDMDTLSGVTSDITTSASVHLYNAANKEITGSTLLKNPDSVIVTVGIEPTKEVPLAFKTSGTPADGYVLTGKISATPAKVTISGAKSVLEAIKEIDVPVDALNVTGQSSDMSAEINVSDYLPSNVSLVNSKTDGKTSVVVYIEKQISKEITLNSADIKVTNLPANETCVLSGLPDQINVSVTGIQSIVNTITASSLMKEFDISSWMKSQNITDLQPGTYAVQLSFNIPDGVTQNTPVAATLTVTKNAVAADTAGNAKTN